jgi:membrane protein insertase Oxa1/YidC/SpoIIIJ
MNLWSAAVRALAAALRSVGDLVGGGPAVGIPLLTFVLRVALIVLAPLAVRTRDRMRVVRRISPQMKALDREFRDDPNTLSARLKALHAENGIGMVDWPGLGAAFIQVPILIALFCGSCGSGSLGRPASEPGRFMSRGRGPNRGVPAAGGR